MSKSAEFCNFKEIYIMRNQQEIRELMEELSKLTGFIADFGTEGEYPAKSEHIKNQHVNR